VHSHGWKGGALTARAGCIVHDAGCLYYMPEIMRAIYRGASIPQIIRPVRLNRLYWQHHVLCCVSFLIFLLVLLYRPERWNDQEGFGIQYPVRGRTSDGAPGHCPLGGASIKTPTQCPMFVLLFALSRAEGRDSACAWLEAQPGFDDARGSVSAHVHLPSVSYARSVRVRYHRAFLPAINRRSHSDRL
jgi:hypothetical protein